MRICEKCGCYIPDLWKDCPACGYVKVEKSDFVGRFAPETDAIYGERGNETSFETVDVNTADGRTTHFPVPTPRAYPEKTITDLSNEMRLVGMGYGCSVEQMMKHIPSITLSGDTRPQNTGNARVRRFNDRTNKWEWVNL